MYEDAPYDRRPSFFAKLFLHNKKPNRFAIAFVILFIIETTGISFFIVTDSNGIVMFFLLHKAISTILFGLLMLTGYITYRTGLFIYQNKYTKVVN